MSSTMKPYGKHFSYCVNIQKFCTQSQNYLSVKKVADKIEHSLVITENKILVQ